MYVSTSLIREMHDRVFETLVGEARRHLGENATDSQVAEKICMRTYDYIRVKKEVESRKQ
jgi:hypothetical protein